MIDRCILGQYDCEMFIRCLDDRGGYVVWVLNGWTWRRWMDNQFQNVTSYYVIIGNISSSSKIKHMGSNPDSTVFLCWRVFTLILLIFHSFHLQMWRPSIILVSSVVYRMKLQLQWNYYEALVEMSFKEGLW